MAALYLLFAAAAAVAVYARSVRSLRSEKQAPFRLQDALESAAADLLRRSGLYPLITARMPQIVRYCAAVYEEDVYGQQGMDPAFRWTARTFGLTLGGLLAAFAVWLAAEDEMAAAAAGVFAVLIPFISYRDLVRKAERRRAAFVSELPAFMMKLSLLLTAGETLQRAFIRASAAEEGRKEHPLFKELARTCRDLERGVPFAAALEEMHRRCAWHEAGMLITTVIANHKRGGEAFALALQDLSRQLMEKKYAMIRTKGEEASAKLLFPMMLMLLSVMMVVAAPAVMMMNW